MVLEKFKAELINCTTAACQLQETIWLVLGGGSQVARSQICAHRPYFRRRTLYFTSMPASKDSATCIFAIRICPRNITSEQIGVPTRKDLFAIPRGPRKLQEAPAKLSEFVLSDP